MNIKTTTNLAVATAITHGGTFHADEVFASVILAKATRQDQFIFRTFKLPEELDSEIVVFDIGFGQYDHHQKGGNGVRDNGVPYAAAGLIWRDYGPQILADTCNPQWIWEYIDVNLIQGIDAVDNGSLPKADYPAQALTLSQIISVFNPNWNESYSSDEAFENAAYYAEAVFDNLLAKAISIAEANKIVEAAIEESEDGILVLKEFAPWQEAIFGSANPKAQDILFVVFPSNRGGYNWQCVPDALGSFGQRKSVPAEWKGLRDSELQEITGVADATFCHPAGFIGGADSLEGAIALAKKAANA